MTVLLQTVPPRRSPYLEVNRVQFNGFVLSERSYLGPTDEKQLVHRIVMTLPWFELLGSSVD